MTAPAQRPNSHRDDAVEDSRSFVVIGGTNLARRVCASLRVDGHVVEHLAKPGDDELRQAIAGEPDGVAVLLHDDVAALRYALALAHLSQRVAILVTIFDRTVGDEVLRLLPQCHVSSPADLAVPALAGPCVDPAIAALCRGPRGTLAVRVSEDTARADPWRPPRIRWYRAIGWQPRSYDAGTRLMLFGLAAILVVLLGDWAWLLILGHDPAEAFFDAARVVATVGPAVAPESSPTYQAFSSAAMVSTIVFSAMFTAGIVERMLGPKLFGVIGPRTVPRSGHVIVVGIGQVGLRLCAELRRLGIPVVGVEREPHAPTMRLARSLGIPVLIAHGGDRAVLERLCLGQARALAAVGSDDLDNIAVAIAAHGVAPGTRVILRAGEHEAIAETRSLLRLGVICDVTGLAATYVAARLLGCPAVGVVGHQQHVYLRSSTEDFVAWPRHAGERCAHADLADSRWD